MLDLDIGLQKLVAWARDLEPQMDQLYEMLPDHVREALERGEQPAVDLSSQRSEAEAPLVADEAFFDEIERFLNEQRGSTDEPDGEQDEPED